MSTHGPRTPVASGDFRIEPSRPQRLEAHLGSCVGVSIVDRHAKVGGLAHFLLPDGGSTGFGYGKAVCARTGLPLFLDALREAGCLPAVMEATVAGGALVGSISRLDLELDLGGRTVDVVNAQLKDAGIAVVASETGGHFGSRLLLDLDTLASTVEPMVDDEPPDPVRPAPLTPDELTRATERIRPIPQTALKIIRLLQTDDYGLKDIAAEIRRDQVLTARIIRACNAAYLGAREEITSIEHALLVLGGRAVGTVTLAMLMETVYNVSTWGYSMSRGGLYHHAVSTAIVSEQLAMITRAATRDLAYTAGLLHDIGKVLLDQSVAAARPLFYREVLVEGAELRDAERSLLGVSHEEAGARLAERWDLPPVLKEVIAHHSDPAAAGGAATLAALVYLADLLVARFDAGHDFERLGSDHLPGALRLLGLTANALPGVIARIHWSDLLTPGYA